MPFYQKGDTRIRYEEAGSGFPLLVTPGGGLNSRVSNWPTAVINAMEEFKNDFRCITMDQRNANGGESRVVFPSPCPKSLPPNLSAGETGRERPGRGGDRRVSAAEQPDGRVRTDPSKCGASARCLRS